MATVAYHNSGQDFSLWFFCGIRFAEKTCFSNLPRSFFVEMVYDFSGSLWGLLDDYDYHFTTEMRVLPETCPFEADFNRDRLTDTQDVIILAENWLSDTPYYDILPRRTGDGILNLDDFVAFGLHWLATN